MIARFISCIAIVFILSAVTAHSAVPNLTGDVWSVCGDDGTSTWHDTRLVFTKQVKQSSGASVEGYFDWRSNHGSFGRENFAGVLQEDGVLLLKGQALQNSQDIVTSRYVANLSKSGRSLVNGVWLDGVPGNWAAVRDGGKGTGMALCYPDKQVS